MPIFASQSHETRGEYINLAVVAIHGLNEDAKGTYEHIMQAVNSSNNISNTIVIVPWFHRNSIAASDWGVQTDISPSFTQSAYWTRNASWISAGDSEALYTTSTTSMNDNNITNAGATVSSFAVLDQLYAALTASAVFPNMQRVTFVGFSAGGQMINRYAWATKVGRRNGSGSSSTSTRESTSPVAVEPNTRDSDGVTAQQGTVFDYIHANRNDNEILKESAAVRFIVSDASSYLYFDNARPAVSCRDGMDTGTTHTCDSFPAYVLQTAIVDNGSRGGDGYGEGGSKHNFTTICDPLPVSKAVPRKRLSAEQRSYIAANNMVATGCNEYNQWKYGTVVLPDSSSGIGIGGENSSNSSATTTGGTPGYSYLQHFFTHNNLKQSDVTHKTSSQSQQLVQEYTQHFRHKDVRYVFGTWDACNCIDAGYVNPRHCFLQSEQPPQQQQSSGGDSITTKPSQQCTPSAHIDAVAVVGGASNSNCCDTYPDATNNDLSTSCGATLQGSNRLQRGLNYMSYLRQYFADYEEDAETSITTAEEAAVAAVATAAEVQSKSKSSDELTRLRGAATDRIAVTWDGLHAFEPVYAQIPGLQHDSATFYQSQTMQQWAFSEDAISIIPSPLPPTSTPSWADKEEVSVSVFENTVIYIGGVSFVLAMIVFLCRRCCFARAYHNHNNTCSTEIAILEPNERTPLALQTQNA